MDILQKLLVAILNQGIVRENLTIPPKGLLYVAPAIPPE